MNAILRARAGLGRVPGRIVGPFKRLIPQRVQTWLARLWGWLPGILAFLFGVVLSFKRPHDQAAIALSKATFTARDDLAFRHVLTSSITTLHLSHFEILELELSGGKQRCTSPNGNGTATLSFEKGDLRALTLGEGKWALAVGDTSRGAITLDLKAPSELTRAYADMAAGDAAKLSVENCVGYAGDERLTPRGRLTAHGRAGESRGLQVYVSYGDPLTVPIFSDVCIDELTGTVSDDWDLQRRHWQSCMLSSRTEKRDFGLVAKEGCPPPESPRKRLGQERGGLRVIDLGLDDRHIQAKFRWPAEATWTPEVSSACTLTFWSEVKDVLK